VIAVVLSLTAALVPSLTKESSYRKPKSALTYYSETANPTLNIANKEFFGFLLTHAAEVRAVDKSRVGGAAKGSTQRQISDIPGGEP